MVERFRGWWKRLAGPEKSAAVVMAAIAAGILILLLGIKLGQALQLVAGLLS